MRVPVRLIAATGEVPGRKVGHRHAEEDDRYDGDQDQLTGLLRAELLPRRMPPPVPQRIRLPGRGMPMLDFANVKVAELNRNACTKG